MTGLFFGSVLDLIVEWLGYIAIVAALGLVVYSAFLVAVLRLAALVVAFLLWTFGVWLVGVSTGAEGADARCEARVQKSIDDAAERDREAQKRIEELNKAHEADRTRLAEELFKKDQEYAAELAAAEAATPSSAECRRATPADDRRLWNK